MASSDSGVTHHTYCIRMGTTKEALCFDSSTAFLIALSSLHAVVVLCTIPVGSLGRLCLTMAVVHTMHAKQACDRLVQVGLQISEALTKMIRHTSFWCCQLSGLLSAVA